jgi:hypothetical protein
VISDGFIPREDINGASGFIIWIILEELNP